MKTTKNTVTGLYPVAIIITSIFSSTVAQAANVDVSGTTIGRVQIDNVRANNVSLRDVVTTDEGIDVGGQKITGLGAGSKSTDAVNVNQLNNKIRDVQEHADNTAVQLRGKINSDIESVFQRARTFAEVNAHNQMIEATKNVTEQLNNQTDSHMAIIAKSVKASDQRTDGLIKQERQDRATAITITQGEARVYTDNKVTASDVRTDGLLRAEQQARVKGDADTLTAANAHSDANDVRILASANTHTDSSVQTSNLRTDGLIVREQNDRTAAIKAEAAARIKGDVDTLAGANRFTGERETVINQRTNGLLRTEQQARVKGDADTLMAANAHSDGNDAKTLAGANGYTDVKTQASDERTDKLLAGEQQARIDGDVRTLKAANHYTDWRVDNLNIQASAETLNKSRVYTDNRFTEAKHYTDNKFGQLNKKMERAEKRINAGIAGVTALASIPYVAENSFSYGVALGNYQNGNALAGGIQYKTSPNTNVRLNVAWDSSNNTALGVGLAGGW